MDDSQDAPQSPDMPPPDGISEQSAIEHVPVRPTVPEEVAVPSVASPPVGSHLAASPQLASRQVGKTRNPWGVWLLGLTLVYPLIWYFKINKELRDFDPSIDVQPGMAVVAITVGLLLIGIPPLVSFVHTTSRIQRAQKLSGSSKRCSALLAIICSLFGMVYLQSQLNKVWDQYGNPPPGTSIRS